MARIGVPRGPKIKKSALLEIAPGTSELAPALMTLNDLLDKPYNPLDNPRMEDLKWHLGEFHKLAWMTSYDSLEFMKFRGLHGIPCMQSNRT